MEETDRNRYREPDRWAAAGILAAGILAVLLFCVWIRVDKEQICRAEVSDLVEKTEAVGVVETVTPGEYIQIEGYAYVEGESIHTVDCRVLLYDAKEDSYLELRTQMRARAELNQTGNFGKNHSAGGFLAKVRAEALPKGFESYEIRLAYRNDGHRILMTPEVL